MSPLEKNPRQTTSAIVGAVLYVVVLFVGCALIVAALAAQVQP